MSAERRGAKSAGAYCCYIHRSNEMIDTYKCSARSAHPSQMTPCSVAKRAGEWGEWRALLAPRSTQPIILSPKSILLPPPRPATASRSWSRERATVPAKAREAGRGGPLWSGHAPARTRKAVSGEVASRLLLAPLRKAPGKFGTSQWARGSPRRGRSLPPPLPGEARGQPCQRCRGAAAGAGRARGEGGQEGTWEGEVEWLQQPSREQHGRATLRGRRGVGLNLTLERPAFAFPGWSRGSGAALGSSGKLNLNKQKSTQTSDMLRMATVTFRVYLSPLCQQHFSMAHGDGTLDGRYCTQAALTSRTAACLFSDINKQTRAAHGNQGSPTTPPPRHFINVSVHHFYEWGKVQETYYSFLSFGREGTLEMLRSL